MIIQADPVSQAPTELKKLQDLWWRAEERFHRPHITWTAEDYKLARSLLSRHGAKLPQYIETFFMKGYSRPLVTDYPHPMRLLAAKINEIKSEPDWEEPLR